MELNKIHNENCLTGLKSLPDNSIDCCVTSPPYYGLRDYGISEQIGLEESPEAFVEKLVQVFEEVRRVLKPKGTLWLNLGDSYNGSGGAGGDYNKGGLKEGQPKYTGRAIKGLKAKDLIGIPWMVAFALRSAGWYLRQDIIWAKPNPMPESVADRCTKSHEYIFLLSKSKQYFYDAAAIEEPCVWDTGGMTEKRVDRAEENHKAMPTVLKNGIRPKKKGPQTFGGKKARDGQESGGDPRNGHRTDENSQWGKVWDNEKPTRNKRTVWTVATKPFREAHFATFPPDLIVDMIKAGCPERLYSCSCCGYSVNLHESNTTANGAIFKEMQELWSRVSSSRSMEQRENILHKKMQFVMDGKTQGSYERLDNYFKGLQNDTFSRPSEQDEIRLCNGTQVGNGEASKETVTSKRSSTSQGQQQIEQSHLQSGITSEESTRQDEKTSNKIDHLSSLWQENKGIGACPKCDEGELIAKRGVVLDCFMGAGTTAIVSRKLNRNYIGFELNEKYIKIAEKRLNEELGMFK